MGLRSKNMPSVATNGWMNTENYPAYKALRRIWDSVTLGCFLLFIDKNTQLLERF